MNQLRLLFFLFLLGCGSHPITIAPKDLNDGWVIATPNDQGIDSTDLKTTIAEFCESNIGLDGVVIVKGGKLIAESYFNDYTPEKLHKIWSITKLVSGTGIGIAADQGFLNLNDTISNYLTEYSNLRQAHNDITIEHLITMHSGIKWKELGGPGSIGYELPYSENWIEYILELPLATKPGTTYLYSTGNTMLLAPIIYRSTKLQMVQYVYKNLFSPLKIEDYEWDKQSEFWSKTQGKELKSAEAPNPPIAYEQPFSDLTNTASGLRMRPRDIAKIGQLYLNKGKWDSRIVISEEFCNASVHPHFDSNEYGYHWRLATFLGYESYFATGFGMQRLFIIPELQLIVVTSQSNYENMEEAEVWTHDFLNAVIRLSE